jgi:hypothetical protein
LNFVYEISFIKRKRKCNTHHMGSILLWVVKYNVVAERGLFYFFSVRFGGGVWGGFSNTTLALPLAWAFTADLWFFPLFFNIGCTQHVTNIVLIRI